MANNDDRRRIWACVVYPESAPADWLQILDSLHVPALVSPLHDKDINNGDGDYKKEHFHVLVMYDGKKSMSQFDELRQAIGGVGIERVESVRGYARYLCHLDNPEKFQYSVNEVRQFGGVVYDDIIGTAYDKKRSITEMISYIDRNNVFAYSQVLRFARYHNSDWFNCLLDSSYIIKEYIAGCRLEFQVATYEKSREKQERLQDELNKI